MTNPERAGPGAPVGGLAALLRASARDCPNAVVLRDDAGAMTAEAAAARVSSIAASLRQCGLMPGDRVALVMGATNASLLALVAALQAQLEPVLFPCGVGPVDMAVRLGLASAVAIVGPTRYGTLALGDTYLSAAALSDSVRLVATLGPDAVDGAADLTVDTAPAAGDPTAPETSTILTVDDGNNAPVLVAHRQTALLTTALALIDQAGINPSKALLTTVPAATLAGLVAGPFAALLGASGLVQHGPFDSRRFLQACDADPDADLVVPATLAPLLAAARVGAGEGATVLLSRFASPASFIAPPALAASARAVDLYALGEESVLSRRRRDGVAAIPPELHDGSLPGRLGTALNGARLERRVAAVGE